MLCLRCSHPLPAGADRCGRCFALNPLNRVGAAGKPAPAPSPASEPELEPLSQPLPPSEPPPPLRASIASEPPPQPLLHEAVTQPPAPVDPLSMMLDEEPPPLPARAVRAARSLGDPQRRATAGSRLLAWFVDAAVLAICSALLVFAAAHVVGPSRLAPPGFGSADYWLDLLRTPRLPALWAALFACLALSYSWLFAALGGRTPGMSAAGLRLLRVSGEPISAAGALGRAVLSLVSAAPALFGFVLCFFDARGQSLHDKLTGTALVRDR